MNKKIARTLVIGYILIAVFGAIILSLPISQVNSSNFIDAFFTSSSAISLTGLIVKNTATDYNFFGQLIILILIQLGGVGYMALVSLFYIVFRINIDLSKKSLLKTSLSFPNYEDMTYFVKKLFLFVILIESFGAFVLSLIFMLEMPILDAIWAGIFHSISAFNNAGFSVFKLGFLGRVDNFMLIIVITSLIIVGGIGYFVLIELYLLNKKKIKNLSIHTRITLITTFIIIIFSTILVLVLEWHNNKSIGELSLLNKIMTSYFTAINYRTAGFNILDLSLLRDVSLFFGSLLMVIGGGAGGTAGGIKVTTLAVILIYVYRTIRNEQPIIFKRQIETNIIHSAFITLTLALSIVLISVMLLSITEEGNKFLFILFEVTSALGTVGVSAGDGGVLSLSALFSDGGKLVIIILMLSGKAGILLFSISIFVNKKDKHLKYLEEKILI
ncbi:TrkH family potassium uptake protein [Helicobacter sp. MIT 14-3879]|uniref:TrkH family potassium uptake protein n=1 Tax=Helicobacter sp. MIT 14-3879 TaxID=2040649 RepID=UPI000E1F8052|nr:TrkH family potassium uptake protein [Helicobacter sp. MIT 14-3879]RDU65144.1 potassium transporter [Helicobacter sp. MIT 14-3879]